MEPITVLIADDHEVVRLGLSTLLRRQPHLRLVGEARGGREAVALVERLRPRVVLMDVRMPDMGGIEACREIMDAWPDTRVIMLTSYADQGAAMASLVAGACGYMLKQVSGEELVAGITRVAGGGTLLDAGTACSAFAHLRSAAGGRGTEPALTNQEQYVLALIAAGKTNREIGQVLFLSEKTVRNYVSNILQKLGLNNRAQAAAYATRRQLREEG